MTISQNTIEQTILEKKELLAILQGLKSKRGSFITQKHGLHHQLVDARRAILGYPEDKPEMSILRQQSKAELQSLLDKESAFEQNIKALTNEIDDINKKIEKLSNSASIEQLLAFTQKIKHAEKDLKGFDEKINQQQMLINSLIDDSEEKLTSLQQKRTQLLADISMDKAKPTDLESLDAEISSLVNQSSEQHSKNHPIKRDASQLIQGLLPHKQVAETILAKYKADLPKVIELFLIGQAEQVAKRYLKASEALIKEHYNLKALEDIRKEMGLMGEGAFFICNSINSLTIPSMNLEAFNKIEQDQPEQHILYTVAQRPNEKSALLSSSKMALKKNFERLELNQVFEMLNE